MFTHFISILILILKLHNSLTKCILKINEYVYGFYGIDIIMKLNYPKNIDIYKYLITQ